MQKFQVSASKVVEMISTFLQKNILLQRIIRFLEICLKPGLGCSLTFLLENIRARRRRVMSELIREWAYPRVKKTLVKRVGFLYRKNYLSRQRSSSLQLYNKYNIK